MLGVGGPRRNLGREALRGGAGGAGFGAHPDARTHKRELARRMREKQQRQEQGRPERGKGPSRENGPSRDKGPSRRRGPGRSR
ncbi:hypothetical protein DN402_24725 [Streptomyces sp. SW4]|nr:hypothetical protein DN402_24725 [Streptomyces sp. SW4]